MSVYAAEEILDAEEAEELSLEPGTLAVVASTGAGDLGPIALAAHRDRIRAGDFGAGEDLPAAPLDSDEAADLLAAGRASGNFADGQAALALYALRRAIGSFAGSCGSSPPGPPAVSRSGKACCYIAGSWRRPEAARRWCQAGPWRLRRA